MSDLQDNKFNKIFITDTTNSPNWKESTLFSKSISTYFNDGPVTFNKNADTIYYTRNVFKDEKMFDLENRKIYLGIFSAVLVGNIWSNITPFKFNNEWYNVEYNLISPFLSKDGKRIYFASDKPGGYGGMDLYYCQLINGEWGNPVNLGPSINTEGNEAYPFVNSHGELFFSSDGHKGYGGKDIFYSRFVDTAWIDPVLLDKPINSEHNDFGLVADDEMNNGYFSSDRNRSLDIFSFKTVTPQLFYCEPQIENKSCLRFDDGGMIKIDTSLLEYRWSFGDGTTSKNEIVTHCFSITGMYSIKLDILDKKTGDVFFKKLSYILSFQNTNQVFIKCPDYAANNQIIEFDASKPSIPGYEVLSYTWELSDGVRIFGKHIEYAFSSPGEYNIKLGVMIRSEADNKSVLIGVAKKINIINSKNGKIIQDFSNKNTNIPIQDVWSSNNTFIDSVYSAEADLKQYSVFSVLLKTSKNKVELNEFNALPDFLVVEEKYNTVTGEYSYLTGKAQNLMAIFPIYLEVKGLGFDKAEIKLIELKDTIEQELYDIIKVNGTFKDIYFDSNGRLTTKSYLIMDQIVKLMKKYPLIKIGIGVHDDNSGASSTKIKSTQQQAQMIVSYINKRGIVENRLLAFGFGDLRPIASNLTEEGKKQNRRLEFFITAK